MISVGVNGYGRIGRPAARQILKSEKFELSAINDPMPIEQAAYLTRHDTVHQTPDEVNAKKSRLEINGSNIPYFQESDPSEIPWKSQEPDIILECSGQFRTMPEAEKHLAKDRKVIVSAPPKDDKIQQYVHGVNHQQISQSEEVISAASCTTNSVCPVIDAVKSKKKVSSAHMTTIHSYTASQNILDGPGSKKKIRRNRAAAENIVPTTTGASQAVTEIIPGLKNSFEATAVRVPTPNVSATDLVLKLGEKSSTKEINNILQNHSSNVECLATTREDKVSSDVHGNEKASEADLERTQVTGSGEHVKLFAWYDNETGYAKQMLRLAEEII